MIAINVRLPLGWRHFCARPPTLRPVSTSAWARKDVGEVKPPFKLLLMGADSFSCATLRALHEAPKGLIEELVVVTPPARRSERGMKKKQAPPLELLAAELGYRTETVPPEGIKHFKVPPTFSPRAHSSILLTASFGYLIPSTLLDQFLPLNTLNVHPSLLPRYRGASPIQYTIMNGDEEMGVSVQELSRGRFDHGRLLGQTKLLTPPNPTFASLEPILAQEGGALLVDVLQNLAQAQANATPQDSAKASLAPKLEKDMARVDWASRSADELVRLQGAIAHQFPLWTELLPLEGASSHESVVIQLEVAPPPSSLQGQEVFPPGTLHLDKRTKSLLVSCCGGGVLKVERAKTAGGKWVEGSEWWNGVGGKNVRSRSLA